MIEDSEQINEPENSDLPIFDPHFTDEDEDDPEMMKCGIDDPATNFSVGY